MEKVLAKLNVVLMADTVTVAESDDPRLWQQVLNVINGDADSIGRQQRAPAGGNNVIPDPASHKEGASFQFGAQGDSFIAKFADFLSLDAAVVEGACAPNSSEPYLHLDLHCWEAFKKSQGNNFGGKSIAPASLAATVLLGWARFAGIEKVTSAAVQKVLATVNVVDKNASRALKGASWLSTRPGGVVVLNPAEITKAQTISRCFCKKDWSEWKA